MFSLKVFSPIIRGNQRLNDGCDADGRSHMGEERKINIGRDRERERERLG